MGTICLIGCLEDGCLNWKQPPKRERKNPCRGTEDRYAGSDATRCQTSRDDFCVPEAGHIQMLLGKKRLDFKPTVSGTGHQ